MKEFKEGMYVYCPILAGGRVCQIVNNTSDRYYPIRIELGDDKHDTFTTEGKLYSDHYYPSIFEATEENRIILSEFYGIEFEAAPAKPKPHEIIQALVERDGHVWCGVDASDKQARQRAENTLFKIVEVRAPAGVVPSFVTAHGIVCLHAIPFNPLTGEEITELPQD